MREPNPDRMYERMTARQVSEWRAYERAFGPIDQTWDRENMSQIHELIQVNNQLTGASITRKGKKNPAGKFRNVIRPWEMYNPPPEDDDDEDDDIDYNDLDDDYYLDDEEDEGGEGLSQEEQIALFDREVFGNQDKSV